MGGGIIRPPGANIDGVVGSGPACVGQGRLGPRIDGR